MEHDDFAFDGAEDTTDTPATGPYTFGDDDIEAARLGVVDRVFGPASSALLERAIWTPPGLAYDLGCGPGNTTRLVAQVTGSALTVGLDASEVHIDRAAASTSEQVRFAVWDATRLPFPAGPADLVYSRLLLAHLPDPVEVALSWTTQLNDGGLVVVDEIEWMTTADAATMFAMSLRSWGGQVVAAGLCELTELRDLTTAMSELRRSGAADEITWGLHHAAYERTVR
ncbi:MAG: class I SAM-dependent methyltransferase [Acidimicrobiales bacterium]